MPTQSQWEVEPRARPPMAALGSLGLCPPVAGQLEDVASRSYPCAKGLRALAQALVMAAYVANMVGLLADALDTSRVPRAAQRGLLLAALVVFTLQTLFQVCVFQVHRS
jgi:hypothetical protein